MPIRRNLAAFTGADQYPPAYVSVNLVAGDTVEFTVRGNPTRVEGIRVCGQTCRPGNEDCNNYCNMAPAKGPMADKPLPHSYQREGDTVSMRMTDVEFDGLVDQLIEARVHGAQELAILRLREAWRGSRTAALLSVLVEKMAAAFGAPRKGLLSGWYVIGPVFNNLLIRVKFDWRHRLRMRLGAWMFAFAGWIIGCPVEVSVEAKPRDTTEV